MFKLNSVGRKLYFSVLAVFLVFAVSFIVFQQAREKQYKIGTLTIKLENYNELLAEDLALSPGEGIILQDSIHNRDVTVAHEKLQDDVAVIEEMIDKFHNGCDIVYGVRKERKTDTFFKRTTAQGFYKVMEMMGVKTVYNHADFRLMSKRAVEQFSKYQETNLFLRGMMPLIGYQTDCVYYDRKERVAGESKYPLKKMLALAFNGISSFSVKPISMILGAGMIIVALSLLAAIYALISYCTGHVVPGWTSLILSIWFLGGIQLMAIGLVGQYIGKIYIEVKHRPRYNIEKVLK